MNNNNILNIQNSIFVIGDVSSILISTNAAGVDRKFDALFINVTTTRP